MFNFDDKKIVIVGGSGGLGKAIVDAFLKYKVKIAVIDIFDNVSTLNRQNIKFIKSDISKRNEIEMSFKQSLQFLGGIDILINCAGIQIRNQPHEFSLEDWDKVLDINLTATFYFCKLAGIEMIKNNYGKIINISSIISFVGGSTIPAYSASKGGVSQLTKSLSNDWAKWGINVNAIAPGYFETPLNANLSNNIERLKKIKDHIPMGRFGLPHEITGLVIFLSSDESSYISGAIIPVDGGYLGW